MKRFANIDGTAAVKREYVNRNSVLKFPANRVQDNRRYESEVSRAFDDLKGNSICKSKNEAIKAAIVPALLTVAFFAATVIFGIY